MNIRRTEKHHIKRNDAEWKKIDELCFKSKSLYNYANYIIRQELKENNKYIGTNTMQKQLKTHELFTGLGSTCSQQTLKRLDGNWRSFFKSDKDYRKSPNKYLGAPKPPGYKHKEKGRFLVVLANTQFEIKNGYIFFCWKPLKELNDTFKTNVLGRPMELRFVPRPDYYVMEIVYEVEVPEPSSQSFRIAGIDLGVNNLITMSNNIGVTPVVVNGKGIKSMNQYYNKTKAKLQSDLEKKHGRKWSRRLKRFTNKHMNKIDDFLHKSSRFVVNWCVENNIDTIVIGLNEKWKQKSKMSDLVNQHFIRIPHTRLINQITYKAMSAGIKIIITEESYTSGTSFLDGEMPVQENYNKSRRIKRGLFKAGGNTLINADLNGAYQIIRKVFSNVENKGDRGWGLHPARVNI